MGIGVFLLPADEEIRQTRARPHPHQGLSAMAERLSQLEDVSAPQFGSQQPKCNRIAPPHLVKTAVISLMQAACCSGSWFLVPLPDTDTRWQGEATH